MERWTLQSLSWLKFLFVLILVLFTAALSLFILNLSYVFITKYARDAWYHIPIAILFLPWAVLFGFLSFSGLQLCFSQVTITPRGVEQWRFGRCTCSLPWDAVAEVGVTLSWGAKGGPYRYLYFADRHLEKLERADMNKTVNLFDRPLLGRLVQADFHGMRNVDILKRLCPLPIPPLEKPKDYEYSLTAYRRERDPDGNWGEARLVWIPDASKIRNRDWEARRIKERMLR